MEGSCQSTLTVVISNSIQHSAEKIQTRPVLRIAFQTLKKTIQMFIIIPPQYRKMKSSLLSHHSTVLGIYKCTCTLYTSSIEWTKTRINVEDFIHKILNPCQLATSLYQSCRNKCYMEGTNNVHVVYCMHCL